MITNYKIVCLVQFNKIEFESSAILALSATVVSYYVEVVLSDSESLSRKSSTGTTRLVSTTVALRAKIALPPLPTLCLACPVASLSLFRLLC